MGKTVRAYTFHLEGYPSKDLEKAKAIARHFGWPLTVVTVPSGDVVTDFVRLAVEQRCRKKTQFEVTFPFLYVFPAIAEAEVWSGFNADDYYGNTKNCVLEQRTMAREGRSHAERKDAFDKERQLRFAKLQNPDSGDTWWFANRLAAQHGKRLFDPYLDPAVRDYFLQFDHKQLSPLSKPLVRQALADELRDLPKGALAVGVQLQTGGGVDSLFATLLRDNTINRFDKRYASVSGLCQRWGREVSRDPDQFRAELTPSPRPIAAASSTSGNGEYQPYTMDDVRRASARRRFRVVSAFAGGGGSGVGYRLAGGEVVLASEFVPEAVRTYAANFPGVPIDPRDIREVAADADEVVRFLARAELRPGELDILDGSPPCRDFSTAGKGIREQHLMRKYSDVQQRGTATLIFDFFRLAAVAMPKVVIVENIPALRSRYGDLFDRALDALRFASGPHARTYFAESAVLTASDFGVPQKRRRLFVIGVRRDVAEAVGITSDADVSALFPEPTHLLPVSVRSALAGLRQSDGQVRPWHRKAMTTSLGAAIRRLPRNPTKCVRLCQVAPGEKSRFSLVRTAWDLPTPTLAVASQQPDAISGCIHPEEDRAFSLPELKRLFALPDDFILTGTLRQAAERVCRMVPPPLTRAIAERVYERVLRPHAEGRP
jgi:DNA-cytosine methyltransferase